MLPVNINIRIALALFALFVSIKNALGFHRSKDSVRSVAFSNRNRGGGQEEIDDKTSSEVSRKMYNKQASNWVRTKPRCLSDFTGRPVVFSMLEPHIKDKDPTILDVGCGEGYCARKVLEMGAGKVIGCDISAEMIKSAVETAKGDQRCSFYTSPCSELLNGLRDHLSKSTSTSGGKIESARESKNGINSSIDIAMAVFLFNYLTSDDMGNCIKQIHTALKPGGIFVFSVPHPSMIFCHDEASIFRLESEGKGYFSSTNEKILGHISTIDGEKLNIMSVHKTLNNYIKAINDAGFKIIDIQEAGVTEEHMKLHPDFFDTVKDRPLHLIFKLEKVE